jgi:hypothetical protein
VSEESAIASRSAGSLIAELMAGKTPAWLEPVAAPEKTALMVWRVVR